MSDFFQSSERVRKVAEAYAIDAVHTARVKHDVHLDYSEASIAQVEQILDKLSKSVPSITRQEIQRIAKSFGSYIGEVFRANYGGEWGYERAGNGQPVVGVRTGWQTFWPWAKVTKRLQNGADDNIVAYYEAGTTIQKATRTKGREVV